MTAKSHRDYVLIGFLAAALWCVNAIWLTRDSRPPVWDMAMHQSYALNYLPGALRPPTLRGWEWSGNYPPLVHLLIALCYGLFRPGPHSAPLANIPASVLLFWAIYELASELSDRKAARWACILTALTPYMVWMSRETILDYWLSAWVAVGLLLLHRTRGFASGPTSFLFGLAFALGMLTKWFFAGFLAVPLLYVCRQYRVWSDSARKLYLADSLLVAGIVAGVWYVPNLPGLIRYYSENARIGAREGEPPVASFQSLIYYLRLLEGYQLFALLFLLLVLGCYFAWRKRLLKDGGFFLGFVAGGWFIMTMMRTKDPRFTMPILGVIAIAPAAWVQSWGRGIIARAAHIVLVGVLCVQVYASNFGIRGLPEEIVLMRGYAGALTWNWNLYLQHYFHILGPPRRENWKQEEILTRLAEDATRHRTRLALAVIPDLPRFSAANFHLYARLRGMAIRVEHPQSADGGVRAFDGYDYALMTERDQGISWTTAASRALNQIIVDERRVFRLLDLFPLPNGDSARLYHINREQQTAD